MKLIALGPMFFLPLVGSAQSLDHLKPAKSVFDSQLDEVIEHYEMAVTTILGRAFSSASRTSRMVVIPSFRNEYAVGLDQQDAECEITRANATLRIWLPFVASTDSDPELQGELAKYPADPTQIGVETKKQRIPKSLCTRIHNAWRHVVLETRYPKRDPEGEIILGLDGVTYHFSTWADGLGTIAGQTWSPSSTSIPGRLVALGEAMGLYAQSGSAANLADVENALEHLELHIR